MKAILHYKYGSPDVLQLAEVEKPAPAENQMLVRVEAVSLNPAEAHMRRGMIIARMISGNGLLRPKMPIIGADFAGVVEAVGKDVTNYTPGDRVFGRKAPGGFAEYVCVSEKPVGHIPANITFEQAAAVPVAAMTALQSLRDAGQVKAGQSVLINGAAGGVGTFTVQIAKYYQADVTAVTSPRNIELVCSLGADRAIDYTRENFTRSGQQYDLIIDNVGNYRTPDFLRALKPNGIYVGIGFTSISLLVQNMVLNRLVKTGNKKIGSLLAKINPGDMALVAEMMASGKVTPFIDRTYTLNEVQEAYRYLETKHARGKLVVKFT